MNLFELFVKLGVQDEASDKISGLSSKLKTGLGTAAKIGTAAIAAVGTASVAAGKKLWDMANQTAQLGDKIDKNSQRLGLSYEAFQKWDYVMQISGSSIDSAAMGMKTLTKAVDSANQGTASAIEKFTRLGLKMTDLKGLSREEIFEKVVFALQGVSDETEKAALATELLGRSGQELLPMLNSTEEDLRSLMAEAQNYGMIMSDDAVRASAAFQDALTKLTHTVDGVKNSITANLLPGLTEIINGFADLVNGTEGAGEKIKSGISNVVSELNKMIPQIIEILSTIVSAVAENAPDIIGALAGGIIDAIPELLSSLGGAISRTINAIIAFFHAPEQMRGLAESGMSLLSTIISGITSTLGSLVKIASDIVKALADGIPKAVGWLVESARSLITNLGNYLGNEENRSRLINSASDIVGKIADGIIKAVEQLGQAAVEVITGFVDFLKDKDRMDELGEAAGEIVGRIVSGIIDFVWKLAEAGAKIITGLSDNLTGDGEGEHGEDLDKIGGNILDAIITAMYAAWDEIVPTLDKIAENLKNYFDSIDWEKTGEDIINDFIDSLARNAAKDRKRLEDLKNAIADWFTNLNWDNIGSTMLDFLLNTLTFGLYGSTKQMINAWNGNEQGQAFGSGLGKGISNANDRYLETYEKELARLGVETRTHVEESGTDAALDRFKEISGTTGTTVNQTINIYAPEASPSEIARELSYAEERRAIHH